MEKKLLEFFTHELDPRNGGPSAYLFHLQQAIKKTGANYIEFLPSLARFEKSKQGATKTSLIKNLLKKIIPSLWINNRRIRNYVKFLRASADPQLATIDLDQYAAIHFHESLDIWRYHHLLKNYRGQVLLTSHSPIPYHLEVLQEVFGIDQNAISKPVLEKISNIDDLAFTRADALIIPCEDAMDGYEKHWPAFKSLVENKPVHIALTGVPPATAKLSKEKILEDHAIPPGSFVISYSARHSMVKGYDLLQAAASELIYEFTDLYFLVAGNKLPHEKFTHTRWIMTGWTPDPASLVHAADVQVIPNRETFFDLNTLETLSMAKPVILADTGGNQYFRQFQSKGITLIQPAVQDIADAIRQAYRQKDMLAAWGEENKRIYDASFTDDQFANHLLNLYKKIIYPG
jgi:glycosyltransferase involved in cell wall biosynthesis